MNDIKEGWFALIVLLCFTFGIYIGGLLTRGDIDTTCKDYGKYHTNKYVLTCEAKK